MSESELDELVPTRIAWTKRASQNISVTVGKGVGCSM